VALTALIIKNAPSWYTSLRGTLLDKSREVAIDKGKEVVVTRSGRLMQRVFHLDEKEQLRHLKQALKNATERGLATFDTLQEHDQYKDIVRTLSQEGPQGEVLRKEVMQLFTLSEKPKFVILSDTYNQRQRYFNAAHQDVDVAPYLNSFFNALIGELYADPYFRTQLSDVLQQRATSVGALEQYPYLVMLGGPGSGKSTATKHLAWSHAATNQSLPPPASTPLLSGNPLPLRIELRRLNEERKRANYDFLSFVTEVLLKREGIEIKPQMFVELLKRRCMVLLFDGLDEVAILDERLGLVGEIEHFALCYPGNRVLVTSRPVGYDLARVSHPLFFHAQVQNFNNEQIQQFLENWYTAVLRVSPIPQRDQEELDLLLTTLKENPRLYKLAENPLLLTVITALHRYERLPDRRVQVYDRCADLLLETWARLRGTDKRWVGMKMIKEEQYACVAYLAFLLHERSQEETSGNAKKAEDMTIDVTSRFLRRHVEDFLKKRELVVGIAEQKTEAKLFIKLIQEEAGLIVERGTDENGEALYSFVHRTFQEYFAAADVYERYLQQEDPRVIGEFLYKHLHDPHWSEVILLLLGKLKSIPVTNQLRQILQRTIKSRRSCYTEIVQQDLFFVCDCLIEEIKVENTLVGIVVAALKEIIKSARFFSQQQKALECLGKLMQTRQYTIQGREVLIFLAMKENSLNLAVRLEAAKILYLQSIVLSEEWLLADQALKTLLLHSDLFADQAIQAAKSLYYVSTQGSKVQKLAIFMLITLLQRSDLSIISINQVRLVAESLYRRSTWSTNDQQLATSMLTIILERFNLFTDQVLHAAESLYYHSAWNPGARVLASSMLITILERFDLSINQACLVAESLYDRSADGSEAQELATSMLTIVLRRSDLSVDQALQTAEALYRYSAAGSETQLLATSMLSAMLQRSDLSVDQTIQVAVSLYRYSPADSEAQRLAVFTHTIVLQRSDLSVGQALQTAEALYRYSALGSELQVLATSIHIALLQHSDLSVDQTIQVALPLYRYSARDSEPRVLTNSMLTAMLQRSDLSIDQILQTAEALYRHSTVGSETQLLATSILLTLLSNSDEPKSKEDLYGILYSMIPQFHNLPPLNASQSSDL
jgi:NACHT domain